jgi:plastocyanin
MRRLNTLALTVITVVLVVVAVGVLAGCGAKSSPPATTPGATGGGTPAQPAAGATITEKGLAFEPSTLEVKVGDVVTFTNEDTAPHNVRIDGTELGSQNQGDSVTWTASKAGTYAFSCTIHPSMTGEITVK